MTGDLLLARVAGERFAVPAVRIQSVIALDRVVPVPRAPAFVAGLTTLRSRTLTVIDVARSLGLAPPEVAARFALVTECDGCGYALAVDSVENVVPAEGPVEQLKLKLAAGWLRTALGVVPTSLGTVLILDLDRLIAVPDMRDAA